MIQLCGGVEEKEDEKVDTGEKRVIYHKNVGKL